MKRNKQKQQFASVAGYLISIMVALQPFLNSEMEFNNRVDMIRFAAKIMAALSIAVCTKYVKDHMNTATREPGDA